MVGPRDTYTHGHHESVLRSHTQRTAENSAGYLLPRLTAGMTLVDIGCGPGTITVDLAERVAPGAVVGLDLEPAVLEAAGTRAADRSLTNVEFRVGDIYALDLEDDSVDVAHAHQVLQHLSDPVAALREMARVVRPGGLVAVRDADYAAMAWAPADPRLDRWLEIYRSVCHGNDADPDAGRHLLSWASEAGLDDIEPSASVWCFATPDTRRWWGSLWADRSRASAFAAQALERGLTMPDELEQIAAGWHRWAEDSTSWFTVVSGELLCTVGRPLQVAVR